MLLLYRWSPNSVRPAFLVIAIVSFGLSCLWAFIDPTGNYYLPHTRAWELLCGSLIALGLVPKIRNGLVRETAAVVGLLLTIAPLVLLDRDSPFPAWNAAPICIGTAMLIHTGEQRGTIVARLLSMPVLVCVGLISYSLYLFHWPIIVFSKYQLLRDATAPELLMMAVMSLVAAWVSWRFVESPFRDRTRVSRSAVFSLTAVAGTTAAALGAVMFYMDGFPARMGNEARIAQRDVAQVKQPARCFVDDWQDWAGDACYLARGDGPTILLWGDSHAGHYARVIRRNAPEFDASILRYTSSACAPVLGVRFKAKPEYQAFNEHVFEVIRAYGVKRIVLAAYWDYGFEKNGVTLGMFERSLATLREAGLEVDVIGDNPDFPFKNPAYLGVRLARRDDPDEPFFSKVRNDWNFIARMAEIVGPDNFYNPMIPLCRGKECLAYENGELLMGDNSHFSTYGATKMLSDLNLRRFFSWDKVNRNALEHLGGKSTATPPSGAPISNK